MFRNIHSFIALSLLLATTTAQDNEDDFDFEEEDEDDFDADQFLYGNDDWRNETKFTSIPETEKPTKDNEYVEFWQDGSFYHVMNPAGADELEIVLNLHNPTPANAGMIYM